MANPAVRSPFTTQDRIVHQARVLYLNKQQAQPRRRYIEIMTRVRRSYRRGVRRFQVASTWTLWTMVIGYAMAHGMFH